MMGRSNQLKMHTANISVIYLLLLTRTVISASLNGQWKGVILSTGAEFVGEVPGGVYSDLEKAKIIPANLKGFNDVKNRWVANESIVYTTDIKASDNLLNSPHVVLTFHGVDTFATIYVNNVEIGKTSNMFLKYNFNIKSHLQIGNNELKVVFESSVKVAEKLFDVQSKNYVIPPLCVPNEYNGECHVNHIRKMHASFGWDWGPAFPSMGIWRDVELQKVENALVTDVSADVSKTNDSWKVIVTVYLETFGENEASLKEPVLIDCALDNKFSKKLSFSNLQFHKNKAQASVKLSFPLDEVQLWWPNGYGEAKLYSLSVKVHGDADVKEKTMKIGFRTVELVQEPLQKGLSFYFKVNDVPMFAKGSNWIPSSVFPEKLADEKTLQNLLQSAKDTHMNMLRVWGGGVYESDRFYEIADEYGIMIWQDFMYACNMYPTTKEFLDTVEEEVVQNMQRLKHHPSIVLWAGNNENEAALYGNWYGTGSKQIYKDDYVKLYVDTIKREAVKVDSVRPFVVSSPSNGVYSEQTNYTGSNPYSNFYGDVHYYNYLKNSWDINQYPVTRFASEYGLQALPSIWTLISASDNSSDLKFNSPFMKHRQHLPGGNSFMKLLISKNFYVPKTNNTVRELTDYVYLSQVTQAVAMKVETELYRLMKSLFNDLGEGMTMGALYWQLNDVWQAPSWSSIDFQGRWKMLHYYVKDFFAPVIITSKVSAASELYIYVVSDLLHGLNNLTVEVVAYEWKSGKAIHTSQIKNVTMLPNESRLITQYWIDIFLEKAGCGSFGESKQNCMIELVLKDSNGKTIAPSNYVYPLPLKNLNLPIDNLSIKVEPQATPGKLPDHMDFQIEISAQNLALFVWLEAGNISGRFSENGFHVLHRKKRIVFHSFESVTAKDITKNILITSLSRIYDSKLRESDVQTIIDRLN